MENLIILTSAITSCISISVFASLVYINVGATSSSVGINICIIAEIKKYKSMNKKKTKKQDKLNQFIYEPWKICFNKQCFKRM